MNQFEFLTDYFNQDENFIIAVKTMQPTGKAFTTHKMLNIKDEGFKKFLGHCYYKNRDSQTDIYFSLNSYKEQDVKPVSRKEEFVDGVKAFYFDIDKEVDIVLPQVIALFGEPTYKITSSKDKYQLIYKFTEPFKGDRSYFKQLLKGAIYHMQPLDKVFDTARIFRLAGYKNKKPNNKDFIVEVEKYDNYYTFEQFETIAKEFILPPKTNTATKSAQTALKPIISKKMANGSTISNFNRFADIKKKINSKYNELLLKHDNDKSTADMAYVKWLRTAKQIEDEEILILKLVEARGYKELMEKHGYQIDYYVANILERTI